MRGPSPFCDTPGDSLSEHEPESPDPRWLAATGSGIMIVTVIRTVARIRINTILLLNLLQFPAIYAAARRGSRAGPVHASGRISKHGRWRVSICQWHGPCQCAEGLNFVT